MQRLQSAFAACCNDPTVRVVLDVNPNCWENLAFVNEVLPGVGSYHDRIKELFRQRNIRYFSVDGVNEPSELSAAVEDYVANNTSLNDRFILMLDRTPTNLVEILGRAAPALAGCYV